MATIKVSPQEFIDAIFGEVPEEEIIPVCPIKENGVFWSEAWSGQKIDRSNRTYYFAPFTLKESAWEPREGKSPKLCRGAKDIACYYAIVLDDIPTKIKAPDTEPSYKLETSPGNWQWGYIIEPEMDLAEVNGFMLALKEAELSDDAALKLTQPFRLPGSWHYDHDMRARLTAWNPERVWSLESLGEAFGIEWEACEFKTNAPPPIQVAENFEDPVMAWLNKSGFVRRDNGEWLDIVCPWGDSHGKGGSDGAHYSPLGRGTEFAAVRTFNCFHTGCKDRDTAEFLEWVSKEGGPGTRAYSPEEAEGGATTVQGFHALFPPVKAEALPDCKYQRKVVEGVATYLPKLQQLATTSNLTYVAKQMGIEVRLNLMTGDPEMVPPEVARPGWYSELPDDHARNGAACAAFVDQCLKLGIGNEMKARDEITALASQNIYSPAEKWVLSAPWDGKDRFEELMDTLTLSNPKDDEVVRMYLNRWLRQVMEAVRGYKRRVAKDLVLTFVGPQGCGKTTWIEALMPGWVSTGVSLHLGGGSTGDRDSIKRATQTPIVELGELDATFRRSDVSQLKSFLSQTLDVYRLSYGRTEVRRPRCSAFAGSVNNPQFLVDATGNRRYLVVPVSKLDGFHKIDMQQLWAQVNIWWIEKPVYHMDAAARETQMEMNDRFMAPTEVEDAFNYYFGPILSGEFSGETKQVVATATCVAKILGCGKDRPSLTLISELLSATFMPRKRQIQGVRNAWLMTVRSGDAFAFMSVGLKLADINENIGEINDTV